MKLQHISLKENHLFRKTYKSGKHKGSETVTVYVLKDKQAALIRKKDPLKRKLNRLGISASKKIGGAVQRNRAKRVVREAYRTIDKTIGIKKSFLIVVVPREKAVKCPMGKVLSDLKYCLSCLDMLGQNEENPTPVAKDSPESNELPHER